MVTSLLPVLFYVAAELETYRREQLVLMLYSMMYTLKFPAESFVPTILVSFSYILSTLPLPYGDNRSLGTGGHMQQPWQQTTASCDEYTLYHS